ncbi:Putative multidrug resistance protein MdtD [Agromyces marinus]|nr:Putative multidrug resistance protein MdtD [Agromyces marinus]
MSHRQILFVIFGLMAGMFLSALDQTVVGTAIRTIGDDLDGLSQQAWVTTAYLILSTISTPIYGKLSDIFGRRPLFIAAIVIFMAGSLLATFSTSMLELAAFRAIQGLGAGGLMSMPLAIMGDMLAPRERARYQGYFLAVFGISSLIGPLVGGLFAGAEEILGISGWRWVFLINVPIGLVALAVVMRFLHLPRHEHPGVRIDWWGASAIIVGLVPLLLVAEEGRDWGWTSPLAIACYALGATGLTAFVFIERAMGDDAIIPLKLFRSATFSMATVIGVFVGFGMFGAMLTLPLYLQLVLGSTPTESGLQMLPMILGLMVASIASGQIIARTGHYRIFPILGTALLAAGFLDLTTLQHDSSYWVMAGAMLLIGLGLGQLMQTLTIASQNSVGLRDMGVATSASTFFRQIGGTAGTAVLLSLLFTLVPQNVTVSLSDDETLTAALDAALDPAVAEAPENAAIMATVYGPIVEPIVANLPPQVDLGDDATRAQVVDEALPAITAALADPSAGEGEDGAVGGGALDDTSFLTGADPRLTEPFLVAFNESAVAVYRVALGVVFVAFVLSLFFRTPPLRAKSAMQEAADERAARESAVGGADVDETADTGSIATLAAGEAGAMVEPGGDVSHHDRGSRGIE